MASPIWKDTYVTLTPAGGENYVDYRVTLDGSVIYSGRAYIKGGGATVDVRINDICADYLGRNTPHFDAPPPVLTLDYERTFVVEQWDTVLEAWDTADTVTFRNDWSYLYGFNPAADGLSFPIDGKAAQAQWLVFTDEHSANTITVHLHYGWDGPDYDEDYNLDFLILNNQADVILDATGVGAFRVFALDLSTFPGLADVTIGAHTWKISRCTGRYALHYVNAYGGWDSFFIAGNGRRTDGLTRHETGALSDNASAYPEVRRNRRNYLNEIAAVYELHTGLMTDRESARMHNLLNSPQVLLEDFEADSLHRVSPVVLTGTSTPHLTYANNGRQLMEYTITAQLAEERLRR